MSNPASRSIRTDCRTSSGVARRSSTSSSRGWKVWAPSETRVTPCRTEERRERGSHRLGIRLDRDLLGAGQRAEEPLELAGSGERRRAAAEKDRLDCRREDGPLALELREQRVDVRRVLVTLPDDRYEVAVAAAMRAEG